MNDDRARRRRVDGMLRRHATEDYEIAEIEAADMRDIHDVYVNLREFVERIARGEVRHPVPEARRILRIPVVSFAATYQAGDPPYEPVDAGTHAVTGPTQHHEKDH